MAGSSRSSPTRPTWPAHGTAGRRLEDINLLPDVFVFDRVTGEISPVSLDRHGTWMEESGAPAIDASGAVVAFTSRHPISPLDVLNDFDLFVRGLTQ